MNRKGFTLIELLAVIVILSSISIVAVSSLTKSLNDRDEKECQEQMGLAKNAAKIYFSLQENTDKRVCVQTLVDKGYFNGKKKIDKLDYDDQNPCKGYVELNDTGYVYNGNCK